MSARARTGAKIHAVAALILAETSRAEAATSETAATWVLQAANSLVAAVLNARSPAAVSFRALADRPIFALRGQRGDNRAGPSQAMGRRPS